MSAGRLVEAYAARELSPVEAVDAVAAEIERRDPDIGAFAALCLDRAREEARAAEAAYGGSGAAPRLLEGVPFAAKDVFDSEGVTTAYGSPMFAGHVPDRDAALVAAVRAAGGLLVGKTRTHEFAWGITTINEAMGSPRNPWDPSLVTGG